MNISSINYYTSFPSWHFLVCPLCLFKSEHSSTVPPSPSFPSMLALTSQLQFQSASRSLSLGCRWHVSCVLVQTGECCSHAAHHHVHFYLSSWTAHRIFLSHWISHIVQSINPIDYQPLKGRSSNLLLFARVPAPAKLAALLVDTQPFEKRKDLHKYSKDPTGVFQLYYAML